MMILIIALILIGSIVVTDFGASWDEHLNATYGRAALKEYYSETNYPWSNPGGVTGPFSFMVTEISSQIFQFFVDDWKEIDGKHFSQFLFFMIGAYSFYLLCLRFVSKTSSLVTTLLLVTQPLLFGHAFINPKDITFMALFLATITSGFILFDRYKDKISMAPFETNTKGEVVEKVSISQLFRLDVRDAKSHWSSWLFLASLTGIILSFEILIFHKFILPKLLETIFEAYKGLSQGLFNQGFELLARNKESLEPIKYMLKAANLYWMFRIPFAILFCVPLVFMLVRMFPRTIQSATRDPFIRALIVASLFLGFSSSTRVLAPFSGLIISIYFLLNLRRKAWPTLFAYWILAFVFMFITRPYFWDDTISRGLESILKTSGFRYIGSVLFDGQVLRADELPSSFSPVLILRQLTEPLLLLIIVGIIVSIYLWRKKQIDRLAISLMVSWIAIPITAFFLTTIQWYDNFRQLLFLLPPLFIFAGIGIEFISIRLKSVKLKFLLFSIALLPGIVGIVSLHPYEYIYYNSWSGGVKGAFRQHELDYWCTSTKEAIEYLNNIAPINSNIEVLVPKKLAEPYIRDDLNLRNLRGGLNTNDADFAVICARSNSDIHVYPEKDVIYSVEKSGATLSVIKKAD